MAPKKPRKAAAPKAGAKPKATVNSQVKEIESLLKRDLFRLALQKARPLWESEGSPLNHSLLEEALLGRAMELWRNRMPAAARGLAEQLAELGVTTGWTAEEAHGLFIGLGMFSEARALPTNDTPSQIARNFAQAEADLAVLHPDRAEQVSAEVRAMGQVVRDSLESILQGDTERGLEALREVPRQSPFADWRLLARGLAARARGDQADMRANWGRLDTLRPPARIARALTILQDGTEAPGRSTLAWEEKVFGAPLLDPLLTLREDMARDDWQSALDQLEQVRPVLSRVDPALSHRLTNALYHPLVRAVQSLEHDEAWELVDRFTEAAEPLPIDPNWDRLRAMIWEAQPSGLKQAIFLWRGYIDWLGRSPALKEEERGLAKGLVLRRLAGESHAAAQQVADSAGLPFHRPIPKREIEMARQTTIDIYHEALKAAPQLRPLYGTLRTILVEWGREDEAAEVARRAVARFPDDDDAHMFLAEHHLRRQEPDASLEHALRVRAIKPLDEGARIAEWSARILLGRELAVKGRFDESRTEFDQARRLRSEADRWPQTLARQAVLEFKAGETEKAESLWDEAIKGLKVPAALHLAMLVEAVRFKLPKDLLDRFEKAWRTVLTGKVSGEVAGALCEIMLPFAGGLADYPGREKHLKEVVDYVRRTSRTKYAHDDLAHVVACLCLLPKEAALFKKTGLRGAKLFPDSPFFLMIGSTHDFSGFPLDFVGREKARAKLEKALELAETSTNPFDRQVLPEIRERLSRLQDLAVGPMGLPFPFPTPGGRSMGGVEDILASMLDEAGPDLDLDDLLDLLGKPPRGRPRKASAPKSKPKKRTK